MNRCLKMHPLLALLADGEADPSTTVSVRRHVRDCTSCRILLAREFRLSGALESMREIDVEEAFALRIMKRIPVRPAKRRRDHRGLKLAGLAGLVGLALAAAATPHAHQATWIPRTFSPTFLTDTADPAAATALGWLQWVLMTLQTAAETPFLAAAPGWISVFAKIAIAVFLTLGGVALGSALAALAAGALLRPASKRESSGALNQPVTFQPITEFDRAQP